MASEIPKPAAGTLEAQLAALPSSKSFAAARPSEKNEGRGSQAMKPEAKARAVHAHPSKERHESSSTTNDVDAAIKQSLIKARNEVNELLANEKKSHAATRKEVEAQALRIAKLKKNLDTSRERSQRERATAVASAQEKLLKAFLPVLDNLERAVAVADLTETTQPSTRALMEGIENVLALFQSSLSQFGVTPYSALGDIFDPSRHEAIRRVEDASRLNNEVVEEYHKGYLIDDRLLRAALVVVASGGLPATATQSTHEHGAPSE